MASFLPFLILLASLATSTTLSPLPPFDPSAKTVSALPQQQAAAITTTTAHVGPLAPILGNLGFQELATAVSALSPPLHSELSGPVTLFAPSDGSFRPCPSCSPSSLLREHLVPGIFPRRALSKLAFGTKLETSSPSRCLTVTSAQDRLFVDGVEITRPDVFVDARLVIHGLQGFVGPLSPLSCVGGSGDQLQLEGRPAAAEATHHTSLDGSGPAVVRLMLRDAIVRLRDGGFSILALSMRIKYAELAGLQNMTIFALDDSAIFSGGHSYVTSVRFHVVPNRLLMHGDLVRLPAGATLPTLVRGQDLVVTHSAGGNPFGLGLRINYVPVKKPDVVYNVKVAVHSIFLPFPQLPLYDLALASSVAAAEDGIFGPPPPAPDGVGNCDPSSPAGAGGCHPGPSAAPAAHVMLHMNDDSL